MRRAFIVVGLLLPTLLAAARSVNVGTDVRVYGYSVFNIASNSTHFSDMDYLADWYQIELGYRLLNFLVSRLTHNIFWLLGAVQLIILVCVYQALKFHQKNIMPDFDVAWGLAVFYFLFYNETLNLIRQSLAIAIILYAFRYVFQRRPLWYCFWVVLAMQFHITAVIAIVIYPIYYFVVVKRQKFVFYGIIIGSIFGGSILPKLISIVIRSGILGSKFTRYLNMGEGDLSLTQLAIRIPFVLILYYWAKKRTVDEEWADFWIAVLLLDFAFAELRSVLISLYRISLYFSWFKMAAYSEVLRGISLKNRKIVAWGLLAFFMLLWWYQSIHMGNNDTYPYSAA
ncbi:MAG: EpsG family protein [Muribaculaceae bacterium]|nr:EpsG family protein [Roseburia sp.]MCM1431361.1 EpsG family protein [Muribaculaceae bacterium]MCM1491803.1 EpsG family protein [Muribaculaceae bacterium]